jgi:exonuclease III/uncharacterized protein Smg (DUF494 family)
MEDKNTIKIKFVNMNVKGIKGERKRNNVLHWANKKKFDIMTMQETHFEETDLNSWKKVWDSTLEYSSGSNKSRGVVTLINKKLDHKVLAVEKDTEGRWVIIKIDVKGLELHIVNFYGPNEDHPIHIETLFEKLSEMEAVKIILTGDFNFVQNINLDKYGGQKKTNQKCQKSCLNWMENNNISDIWRLMNPNKRQYTWVSNSTPKVMCRLDYFLISDGLQGHIKYTDIIPGFLTDHSCTTMTMEIKKENRGKGFWKFNASLAQDMALKDEIRETIINTIEENPGTDDCLLWDVLKCRIRGTCISYSSKKNKENKKELENIEQEIKRLESILQQKIQNNEEYTEIERELNEQKNHRYGIIAKKTNGDIIRSKCDWLENGHTASKLFLNIEKTKGEAKTIRKLKTECGEIITNKEKILLEEEKYYKKLYSLPVNDNKNSRPVKNMCNSLWEDEGPKLIEGEDNLVKEITENEVRKIIEESPINKSPGTDGLTNEFYKEYWPLIKNYMLNSYNLGLKRGKLNISQRRGIISLIPKPQKNLEELKNWRPITLLNNDYKYLTKLLAKRLEGTLSDIISSDQSGFIKGRYIGCNTQRLQNLIEMVKQDNTEGILINIDFEKAFDTIEWSFIYKCLEHLNYPKKFIDWIKTLYCDIETCVINNGNTTKFFKTEKGVRQGCPISPYLFIITTEMLNRIIKKNLHEDGIKDNKGNNYIITQFADDTSFALKNINDSLHKLFDNLKLFGEICGLKINIEKTEILPIGITLKNDIPKRYKRYVKDSLNYLGCTIYESQDRTTDANIAKALNKIDETINKWKNRKTTLSGKISVIKSLLLPQLTYTFSIMASPNKEKIQEINKKFYDFLNSGGSEKIKRKVLIGEYETGGYKMVDLESYLKAIKINWIVKLLNIEGLWKGPIENKMDIDIRYLVRCNLKYADFPQKENNNKLWKEIWTYWCEENYKKPGNIEEILNNSLWMNSNIKIGKKVAYWKNWANEGIKWVQDLVVVENDKTMRFFREEEMQDMGIENYNFMQYNSLMSAIPRKWKREIIGNQYIEPEEERMEDIKLIDSLVDIKKPMKKVYKQLVKNKCVKPIKALEKWKTELGILSEEKILNAHRNNHWCSINNKIRSFCCNFLNRNIPTNRRLTLMKLHDSENCDTCGKKETILHLYWECKEKEKLWLKLKEIYEKITTQTLDISKEKCLLGIEIYGKPDNSQNDIHIQRLLFLLLKYYIHRTKCSETETPTELGMELYIKNYLNIELETSKQKGTYNKFINIWENWITWIMKKSR